MRRLLRKLGRPVAIIAAATMVAGLAPSAVAAVTGERVVQVVGVTWDAGNGLPASVHDRGTVDLAFTVHANKTWFGATSLGTFEGYRASARALQIETPHLDNDGTCGRRFVEDVAVQVEEALPDPPPGPAPPLFIYFSQQPCDWEMNSTGFRDTLFNGRLSTKRAVFAFGRHLFDDPWTSDAVTCVDSAGVPVPLSTSCARVVAGDPYDVLGGDGIQGPDDGYPGEFSASKQAEAGWLSERLVDVPLESPTFPGETYTISAIEHPERAPQVLRINDGGRTFWVEYRLGRTAALPGVVVRTDGRDFGPSALLDMTPGSSAGLLDARMEEGQTWSNPLGFLRITVQSSSTDKATIRIESTKQPIPDVRSMSIDSARATLLAAGFHLGTVTEVVDHSCKNIDTVVSQTPSAGTLMPLGTAVNVKLGVEPATPCQ